ncbi:hypothetical protein MettiDRAFT_2328 [Methanolobus tindarius DSM 2278]|uniref:Uncharacterized protein n=1 Tax=Methanolobus tindarius DSM 2278 TaxID=1090322 RepID=W9DYQ3_METTI|nr:hypothetical protein [Methanolobus tindarius]ETA68842.1 hypothetical protein MettiDRAFT_2328 [Methanolobus tindarius DSM 2278]
MEGPLGKIYGMPAAVLLVVGMVLSAFLFYSLMKAAENGNVLMVVILSIAISIVAFVISKAIKFQNMKKF